MLFTQELQDEGHLPIGHSDERSATFIFMKHPHCVHRLRLPPKGHVPHILALSSRRTGGASLPVAMSFIALVRLRIVSWLRGTFATLGILPMNLFNSELFLTPAS